MRMIAETQKLIEEKILKGEGSYRQAQKSTYSHAFIGQVFEDQLQKSRFDKKASYYIPHD